MLEGIAIFCLIAAIGLLVTLSVVDLRTRLLPNEMVAGFATLGILFHLTTQSHFVAPLDIAMGGLIGFLSLYALRAVSNHFYGADALGLGDVKLMGAGGLWLGPEALMMSLVFGATASIIHGLFVAVHTAGINKTRINLSRLQIPAGPGFAFGIVLAGIWKFKDIVLLQ